jgi:hypothetical protein
LIARDNTRCIEAIGAGVCVGVEPVDRFIEIGTADQKAFGASYQKSITACLVDGFSRRANSFDCDAKVIERLGRIAGRVLYR